MLIELAENGPVPDLVMMATFGAVAVNGDGMEDFGLPTQVRRAISHIYKQQYLQVLYQSFVHQGLHQILKRRDPLRILCLWKVCHAKLRGGR